MIFSKWGSRAWGRLRESPKWSTQGCYFALTEFPFQKTAPKCYIRLLYFQIMSLVILWNLFKASKKTRQEKGKLGRHGTGLSTFADGHGRLSLLNLKQLQRVFLEGSVLTVSKKYWEGPHFCSVHHPSCWNKKASRWRKINLPATCKVKLLVTTKRYRMPKFSTAHEKRGKLKLTHHLNSKSLQSNWEIKHMCIKQLRDKNKTCQQQCNTIWMFKCQESK